MDKPYQYGTKKPLARTLLDLFVALAGIALLFVFLMGMERQLLVSRQHENAQLKLDIAQKRLLQNEQEALDTLSRYDAFGQAKADAVAYFLDATPDSSLTLAQLAGQWELAGLSILSGQDTVLEHTGVSAPDLRADERFDALVQDAQPVWADTLRYYVSPLQDGRTLLAARDGKAFLDAQQKLLAPETALDTIKVGTAGYILALDAQDQSLLYHPDPTRVGLSIEDAGLDAAVLADGYEGFIRRDGVSYLCHCRADGDYLLVAVLPESAFMPTGYQVVSLLLALIALVLLLMLLYAHFLRSALCKNPAQVLGENLSLEYIRLGKRLYLNRTLGAKVKNVFLVGLVLIALLSFYAQTLTALSHQAEISSAKLEDVSGIFTENEQKAESLVAEYTAEYTRRAQNIATLLAGNPSLVTHDALVTLAEKAQVRMIYVFDQKGRTVATNTNYYDFVLSSDPLAQSYPFWDVAKGYQDVFVQDAMADDTSEHQYIQYVGVKRLDAPGMVQLGISPQRLASRLQTAQLPYVLSSIAVENGGFLFAVEPADGTFLYHPTPKYTGRSAADIGLTASALRDEYIGYQTMDGTRYFVAGMEHGGVYVYSAVPVAQITVGRLSMTALVTLSSLVIMLALCASLLLSAKPHALSPADPKGDAHAPGLRKQTLGAFDVVTATGETRRVDSVIGRWQLGGGTPFSQKTPDEKLKQIVTLLLGGAALALIALLSLGNAASGTGILAFILSQRWEKVPNLFSFTYIAVTVLEILVVTYIVRRVLLLIMHSLGTRSETIGRLLDNFIKYASAIGALFYSLTFIGVDSGTLLASAGILTLIVGLGSKDLIGDILAGVFIVFEGEFRVGDIVTVGDWRGTVMEIGIRTTKIMSPGQDIKIVNNSSISGVINMTKQYSYSTCDVGVEYGESLEHIESVLERELPHIKEHLPAIVAGPFYKGVVSLGDSSVVIRILAQCRENDRVQLGRDLNREVKLMFDHNGINIPFPQIVLNQPTEHAAATPQEKSEAAQFVKGQRILTKDVTLEDREEN